MPYLDAPPPTEPSAKQWHTFLKHAFQRCVPAEQLVRALTELTVQNFLPSEEIAKILMTFRARRGGFDVSRIFQYAKFLLQTKTISSADLLNAMLEQAETSKKFGKLHMTSETCGLPTCEERMFTLITQLYLSSELSINPREAHRAVFAVIRWMRTVVQFEAARQLESAGMHTPDVLTCGMYEALGSMSLTILSQPGIKVISRLKWWKQHRAQFVTDMESFDLNILQWMQSQLSGRLRALSKILPFVETDDKGRPVFTEEQILESVTDLPIMRCRPGLYIWLNACLCGRPLTDDMSMLGYLQTRYPADSQSLTVDLLVASFDILTNSLLRKEPRQNIREIRSFICNKIPVLLNMMSGYFGALTPEACIQMAFMGITMDVLPPISAGSTDIREMLKKTRLEFLQSCTVHGLVSEAAITAIIQEPAPTSMRVARQSKEALVARCNNNVGQLEGLVEELQNMNGNAGAVAGCVVEVVNNLCMNKDTMSLKSVCNMLLKRVPDMDIVLQYAQPASILMPLCTLLNDWSHDEDQTEFTPAYEEFASILLFTLTVIHRYGLEKSDLGVVTGDSFIPQLLQRISENTPTKELTAEQSGQLARWVEGLFSTDDHGEVGGIGDEVMRQCPPRAFYLLVPTLFEQSVLACKANALSMKTLKGGLELLLEPFLLPALIGGLSWLVRHSWEDHGDADILLQVLDKLLKPSSSSSETQAMHRAVLGIVATPLSRSLEELVKKRPDKKFAVAFVELLKPYLGRQRTTYHSKTEPVEWASTRDGGFGACVQNAIRDMISWTSSVGPSPPTNYTHKMFTTACQVLGPSEVLVAIVDEIKQQTLVGNGSAALDIATAMICAPTSKTTPPALGLDSTATHGPESQLTVRDALRLTAADTQNLLKRPISDAEAILRLSRRVEAQSNIPQLPQVPMVMQTQDQAAADEIMKDLGFTDADVVGTSGDNAAGNSALDAALSTDNNGFDNAALGLAATSAAQDLANLEAGGDAMQMDQTHDFFDLGLDMNSASQAMDGLDGANLTGDGNQEEDIFAGLDMGMGDLGDDFTFA